MEKFVEIYNAIADDVVAFIGDFSGGAGGVLQKFVDYFKRFFAALF